MSRTRDIVEIAGEVLEERERAFRFHDGAVTVWLPKSQCEWDAGAKVMHVPEWLASEKGLI
nr:hypothetical protein [uncultured Rhodopila sp.]